MKNLQEFESTSDAVKMLIFVFRRHAAPVHAIFYFVTDANGGINLPYRGFFTKNLSYRGSFFLHILDLCSKLVPINS